MKAKQALSLLLILSSLITAASCGSEPPDDNMSLTDESTDESSAPEETTISDSLPSDLDFGGETFTMLVNGSVGAPEFFVDEQDGDVVNDAIYNRNARVSERLNVNFKFIEEPERSTSARPSRRGSLRASSRTTRPTTPSPATRWR